MSPGSIALALGGLHRDLHVLGPDDLVGRDPGQDPENLGAGVLCAPSSVEATVALVKWCAEHSIPVVPQGGRTSLAGGAVSRPGQVILSSQRLTRIEELDASGRTATVQAGVILQVLQDAAARYGLAPGIDLGARGSATMGGMAATNAGGILAFRNGVMRHQILGLEAVLPDGRVMSDLTQVVKVSAGPDLKHLFIGAEGALGFITRLVVKLDSLRPARASAIVGVKDARSALDIASRLSGRPGIVLEAAEMMWPLFTIATADEQKFDLSWLSAGAASFIVEVSASSEDEARQQLEAGLAELWDEADVRGCIVAQSAEQGRRIWALREESFFVPKLHRHVLEFDISIPPASLDRYVAQLGDRLLALAPGISLYVYGHIADGNLHIAVASNSTMLDERQVEGALYRGIAEIGGSFSAEHGVGFKKRHGYETFADEVKRSLALQIKRELDPGNLFNPGKVPFA